MVTVKYKLDNKDRKKTIHFASSKHDNYTIHNDEKRK